MIGVVTRGCSRYNYNAGFYYYYYVRSYTVEYFDNNMNTMQPISNTTGQHIVSISKMFYVVHTVFYLRYKYLVLA